MPCSSPRERSGPHEGSGPAIGNCGDGFRQDPRHRESRHQDLQGHPLWRRARRVPIGSCPRSIRRVGRVFATHWNTATCPAEHTTPCRGQSPQQNAAHPLLYTAAAAPAPGPSIYRALEVPGGKLTGEGEDCLVLNVWTPALNDGRKRPVMFWLHGGGFRGGRLRILSRLGWNQPGAAWRRGGDHHQPPCLCLRFCQLQRVQPGFRRLRTGRNVGHRPRSNGSARTSHNLAATRIRS